MRTRLNWRTNRWDKLTVKGISSGVSLHANPTIMPWSPAPMVSRSSSLVPSPRLYRAVLTPWLMSCDCSCIETLIPQLFASIPYSELT